MYAVIRTGGKQYRVKAGDVLKIEKIEKSLGEEFDLSDVLMISGESSHVGSPLVKDGKVTVVVTQQSKSPKIIIFKRRRRQGYRRLTGHRQPYTEIFVKSIVAPNGEKVITEKNAPVKDPQKKIERAMAQMEKELQAAGTQKPKAAKRKAAKAAPVKKAAVAKRAPTKAKAKKTAAKKAAKTTGKKTTKKK